MSPHRLEYEQGAAAFHWWGQRFWGVWRVIVQVARPQRSQPSPYSFHRASACEGCGRPGVEGVCASCQHRMAAAASQFWDRSRW